MKIKIFKSVFIRLVLPYIILLFLINFYFLNIIHLPAYKKNLIDGLLKRTKVTGAISIKPLKRALLSGDDILTMDCLKTIAETDDFMYARVFNSSGTVVAHNNINEWGKTYTGKLTKKIINLKKPSFFPRINPDGYDYSIPFEVNNKRYFFSIGISNYGVEKNFQDEKNRVSHLLLYITIGAFIFGVVIMFFIIIIPLKKLKNDIRILTMSHIGEKLPEKGSAEISSIIETINEFTEKIKKEVEENKQKIQNIQKELKVVLLNIVKIAKKPYIIVDSSNQIIDASDKLPFKSTEIKGKNILDLPDCDFFLDLIKESVSKPFSFINALYTKLNINVHAVSITLSSEHFVITIIFFE